MEDGVAWIEMMIVAMITASWFRGAGLKSEGVGY